MSDESFYSAVRAQWNPGDETLLREVIHSVLYHLVHRVPSGEAVHVLTELPVKITQLAARGDRAVTEGPREEVDAPDFYTEISGDAGVSYETAREATRAVFHAVKVHIRPEEIRHVQEALPEQLERLWTRA